MNILLRNKFLAVTIISILLLISCSSSENTIVIEEAPTTSENTESTASQEADQSFQQLAIGEINPIRSLDPLFADNASTMRALQLVYEGLVRYDENGDIAPAIAQDWTVSNDNKTYRFNLNNDLFYHDSDIFTNGLGRKLVAADVKYVFERMAKANVPDKAAQLFMNIRGFEPYFKEQHQIMIPSDRQLKTISGIQAPNDSTITFSLVEPDSNFINKLATPYALIYPKQAVSVNGFKAVGSGPFRLSQKRDNSHYIFAKFENYRVQNQPVLNRVDIQANTNETAMLNALNNNDIQLIPQLGPEQMKVALSADGELKDPLSNMHTLLKYDAEFLYLLEYNSEADLPKSSVIDALTSVNENSFFSEIPESAKKFNPHLSGSAPASLPDSLSSTYTDNPFIKSFYSTLQEQLLKNGVSFETSSTKVVNRNIPLFTSEHIPLYFGDRVHQSQNSLLSYRIESWGIAKKNIQNLSLLDFPWWIDFRTTTLPTANR